MVGGETGVNVSNRFSALTSPVGEALLRRFTPAMFQAYKDAL